MKWNRRRVLNPCLVLVLLVSAAVAALSTPGSVRAEELWGPDRAVAPAGDWEQLSSGQDRWYAFEYAGDGSQIEVRLQVATGGAAASSQGMSFVVWTPQQIQLWGLGQYVEPIGRGADDAHAGGVLTWSGGFTKAGTYYVVVQQAGDQPGTSYYLLDIEGDGVSLQSPAPVDTAESETALASPPASLGSQRKPAPATGLEGKLVFQTTYGGDFYTINADGTGLRRITDGTDPVWSPDGTQIAFARLRDPRGIWLVNADGSGERQLFDWPRQTGYLSWSPDGEEIVFFRQHRGRVEETERCAEHGGKVFCFTIPPNPHYNLAVVRVSDGSFWEPLPSSSERSFAPDWSPAGDSIVYADVYGLFVQSTDGQTRYQLTDNNKDTNPVWSPDGEQVVFTRRQHDHWEIYLVDAGGANLKRLTTTPAVGGVAGNSVAPAWSPDGSHLAFLTDRSREWQIWVMGADGSNQRPLFDTELDGLALEYTFNGERAIDWTR